MVAPRSWPLFGHSSPFSAPPKSQPGHLHPSASFYRTTLWKNLFMRKTAKKHCDKLQVQQRVPFNRVLNTEYFFVGYPISRALSAREVGPFLQLSTGYLVLTIEY